MGEFTVPCGISGIPIIGGDPIVGFNVEDCRFDNNKPENAFIPINLPVVGKYDDYGRLVKNGKELRSNEDGDPVVLCHKEIWDAAAVGYDRKFKGYNGEKHISIKGYFNFLVKEDLAVENIEGLETNERVKALLQRLTLQVTGKNKFAGLHANLFRLLDNSSSGALEKDWNERVKSKKPYTNEEFKLLSQMIMVYHNIYFSGRQITPTNHSWTAQCTDYKREAEWHNTVAKFCAKKAKSRR